MTSNDLALAAMTRHLSHPLGSQRAHELANSPGLAGMEAIDAMLMAVKSQNEALIRWICQGVEAGAIGAGAPPQTFFEAAACGALEALESKPAALLCLLGIGAERPGLVLRIREAALSRFGHETSFLAVAVQECVLRQVLGPGKPAPAPESPAESLESQTQRLCEAFWASLSPSEAASLADEELDGLGASLSVASYGARRGALEAALRASHACVAKAALELSAAPGAPRRGSFSL